MFHLISRAWNRRVLMGALGLWLIAWQVHSAWFPHLSLGPAFSHGAYSAILLACALMTFYRGIRVRSERAGWMFAGAGLLLWALGDVYFTVFLWNYSSPPVPSPADVGFLLFVPVTLVGLIQLWRVRLRWTPLVQRTDGLIAALAVSALSASIVFETVLDNVAGSPLAIITNLAYPVSDLVLLGVTVGALGAMGWRPDRVWLLVSLGIAIFTIADSVFLVQVATNTYKAGGILDSGWSTGVFLIALASMERREPVNSLVNLENGRVIGVPLAFAGLGLLLLCFAAFAHLNSLAIVLSAATLAAVMGRLALTFNENVKLLRRFREESLTDVLTGLGNRRALAACLENEFPQVSKSYPLVLVLLDLDGFKQYNDKFGHPAGDVLLVRVATKLRGYFGRYGEVFRIGGDEFCAVFPPRGKEIQPIIRGAEQLLNEKGEGFFISCSYGAIVMPFEASSPEQALALADQRMYEDKNQGKSRDERSPLLDRRAKVEPAELELKVIEAATTTARRMGLSEAQVNVVREATELRDIGKIAVPDSILDKPGTLNAEEAEVMRGYPAVAERLISAESHWHVAQVVRTIHERWDGTGYPDRLVGPAIPLPSRIVAVADAMIAMTSPRAYRAALNDGRALSELGRNAGSQFDPEVVQVFVQAWNELQAAVLPGAAFRSHEAHTL